MTLHVPTGHLVQTIGLPQRVGTTSVVPSFYGIAASLEAVERIRAATGQPAPAIARLHLTRYDQTALDLAELDPKDERSLRRVSRREWARLHGTAACPTCLERDGYWNIMWKLTTAPRCLEHQTLLVDACPSCRRPFGENLHGGPALLSATRVSAVAICGARTIDGPCGHQIGSVEPLRLPLVGARAQRVLADAADGSWTTVGGTRRRPAELYAHLRVLAAVVRFASSIDLAPAQLPEIVTAAYADHVQPRMSLSGGVTGYTDRPRSTAAAAAILAVLEPALTSAEPRGYDHALADLCDAVADRRRELRRFPIAHLDLPEVIARAGAAEFPHARIARHSLMAVEARPGDVDPAAISCVPELLDAHTYDRHVRALLPGTLSLTGRRFAALAVARTLGAASWRQAAHVTGCDEQLAVQTADVVGRRVEDVSAFWESISHVADGLRAGPIDYRARRRNLAGLTEVAADALPIKLRRSLQPWTRSRRRCVAARIWMQVAGGDWRTSPALQADGWNAKPESRREIYRRFTQQLTDEQAASIDAYGTTLTREHLV